MTTKKQAFHKKALALIHKKGFKATTMRDLAVAMNCDVANIYNYTKSKQALLEQFLFEISQDFNRGIQYIIQSNLRPEEKIQKIISLYVRLTAEKPYHISLLVNEWRQLKEPNKTKFIKERKRNEKRIHSVIVDAKAQGLLNSIDPVIGTHLLLSSLRWLFDRYISEKVKLNPIEMERQITLFIMNAFTREKVLTP